MQRYFLTGFLVLVLLSLANSVSAHERRVYQIGDKQYLFVVGSLNEPLFVDDKSGVDLRIKLADPSDPGNSSSPAAKAVENLQSDLKVEISAGSVKREFAFQPAFGDPGAYKAPFFPTLPTAVSYRIFGKINGVPVDLSFPCNPSSTKAAEDKTAVKISEGVTQTLKVGSFGCPKERSEVEFPEKTMSAYTSKQQIMRATWHGWIGLGLGAAALVLASFALRRRKSGMN